ncbi:MAG: DapH/DapD/GlmU-related protein [Nakamurella sp.]
MRIAIKVFHRLINRLLIQIVYGTEIDDQAFIGRRVLIGHHVGVQIPGFSVIGDDSVIRHNVTLGFTGTAAKRHDVPRIGRRVEIGTGATMLGPITIGDDAKIGPHSLVMVNVPAGATAFSQPARILRSMTDAEKTE